MFLFLPSAMASRFGFLRGVPVRTGVPARLDSLSVELSLFLLERVNTVKLRSKLMDVIFKYLLKQIKVCNVSETKVQKVSCIKLLSGTGT